jgi:hypothetical protein
MGWVMKPVSLCIVLCALLFPASAVLAEDAGTNLQKVLINGWKRCTNEAAEKRGSCASQNSLRDITVYDGKTGKNLGKKDLSGLTIAGMREYNSANGRILLPEVEVEGSFIAISAILVDYEMCAKRAGAGQSRPQTVIAGSMGSGQGCLP